MYNPLNLRKLFGDRYKITLEETAHYEQDGGNDPWFYQIICKYGMISPYSNEYLSFYCSAQNIRNRLSDEHPKIRIKNWSDDGTAVFLFAPDDFETIGKYARPKKRRGRKSLSDDEREKFINSGRRHQFRQNSRGKTGASDPKNQ